MIFKGDSVTASGLDQLAANMDKLFRDTEQKAIKAGSNAGIEVYRRGIRQSAPVRQTEHLMAKDKKGGKRGPGYLKKHIGRWQQKNPDGSLSTYTGPTRSAFYGLDVEAGHRNRRTKAEARAERYGAARRALVTAEFGGADTPAHPFMRPVFDSKTTEAEGAFAEAAKKELLKELPNAH